MLDTVIRGGIVVDGTGRERRRADVGIKDGRISSIGPIDEPAARTIDASGSIVSPGFVDVHTHLDAQVFWDPHLTPSPLHGVTTIIGGNCGFSIAPVEADDASYLLGVLSRAEGISTETLLTGVPWDWTSTAEYLDRIEGRVAINCGFMAGHTAIRRAVMGPDANAREATEAEIAAMAELLDRSLAAGAMGFSTAISPNHSDGEGKPIPSRWASRDELVSLAKVCGRHPGTSLQIVPRSAFRGERFDAFEEDLMIAMSVAAQRPVNWVLLQVHGRDDLGEDFLIGRLDFCARSAEHGARVVAVTLPMASEVFYSFDTCVFIAAIEGWSYLPALSHADRLAELSDPAARARLAALALKDTARSERSNWNTHVIHETFTEHTARYQGMVVGDIARAEGKEPFDALLDIVVADDLRTRFREQLPDETRADWAARAHVARHPNTIVGGGDTGAHLDMLCFANYPTVVLKNFVRIHDVMSLEETIHLLAAQPAELYGLDDRGTLEEGKAADIVIFDANEIGHTPLTTRFDLPGHAPRFYTEGTGISRVLVNGSDVVVDGELCAGLPGKVLRSGRDSATPRMPAP